MSKQGTADNGRRPTFWGVVPARAGSKGIPHKNRVAVCGKELVRYTFDEAVKVDSLDRIILSTDDSVISSIAKDYQRIEEPFSRPAELSGDTIRTADVLIHLLKTLGELPDFVVILQPTSPLRKAEHIEKAVSKMIEEQKWDSLASVTEIDEPHPYKMKIINDGCLSPLISGTDSEIDRQSLPKVYRLNGAIYIVRSSHLLKTGKILGVTCPFVMEHKYSVNIDCPKDLVIFEDYLKREGVH